MSDTKHTNGPWHEGSHRAIESHSGTICEVYSHMGIEEADANQKLIAAAPELLYELETLVQYAQGGDVPPKSVVDRARAAIAKATGGVE